MKVFKKIAVFCVAACSLAAAALTASAQNPQQETLLNGMKVLMWSDPAADSVSVRVRIHAGSSFDPQGKEGVMQLLSDSLFPNEAAREFFAEDLGGSLQVTTNYDYIEVSATAKPANFLTMLETVSTAVSNPQIDKELTAKLRLMLLSRIDELSRDPAYVADTKVAERLFGSFPYGRPTLGSKGSVARIDFADLIDARQRFLTADNATVAVTGNFDKALGFRAIRRFFGGWLKSDRRIPSTFKQPDDPPTQTLTVAGSQPGSRSVRFAFRGPARSDKELGSSLIFTSVLESRLRARLAAAKDLFVRNENHILPGSVVIGFSIPENETNDGNTGWAGIISSSIMEPVTDAEFSVAKQAVQSGWSKKDVAAFWLDADTYKITNPAAHIRAIESITIGEVRSYADKARQRAVASIILNPSRSSD